MELVPELAKSVRTPTGGIDREDMHTLIASTGPISHCLNAGGMGRIDYETETLIAHSLRADGFDAGEDGPRRGTPLVPVAMRESGQGYWMEDDIAGTLRAEGEDRPSRPSHVIGVPVAHAFDARQSDVIQYGDQGGPLDTDGHTMAIAFDTYNQQVSDVTHTLRDPHGTFGDALPAVAFQTRIGRNGRGYSEDVVPALNGADAGATSDMRPCVAFHANMGGNDGGVYQDGSTPTLTTERRPAVTQHMAVRRLTPRECARLQGFPDDYLDIVYRGKLAADGPRYKALGNSFAVPVVRWIGQRIQMVDDLG